MLHFEGDKRFAHPLSHVWQKLTDASFLVACVPGVQSISRSERRIAGCSLKPGFAFVRGTLDVTLEIAETTGEESAKYVVQSKGIGSGSQVEAILQFSADETGTSVNWKADVKEVTGLLKAVPQGLVKASAQKVIADLWNEVEAKLKST